MLLGCLTVSSVAVIAPNHTETTQSTGWVASDFLQTASDKPATVLGIDVVVCLPTASLVAKRPHQLGPKEDVRVRVGAARVPLGLCKGGGHKCPSAAAPRCAVVIAFTSISVE